MVDPATSRRLSYRAMFFALCAMLIFLKLLPIGAVPGGIPAPDLMFCFMAAWMMRRPNYVPVLLVAFIFVLSDIVFLRPIGLWSALIVLGSEFLRSRSTGPSEIPVPAEIALVSFVFAAMFAIYSVVFVLLGTPHAELKTAALHVLTTVIAYPFVIGVTHFILRVRRAKPSDLDAGGNLI
jgi:rod shape-determining protein MreD